jgi:rRNA maturation RNase YbeY
MTKIDVYSEGIALPYQEITRQKVKKIAASVSERLDLKNVSLAIIITGDAYIRKINKEFRGLDEPTDVIAFSNRDNPFPSADSVTEEIGDVYISVERAHRQAGEYRVTLPEEVKRLVVHGILHLAGYDHERSDEDEEIMLRMEDDLCGSIDG